MVGRGQRTANGVIACGVRRTAMPCACRASACCVLAGPGQLDVSMTSDAPRTTRYADQAPAIMRNSARAEPSSHAAISTPASEGQPRPVETIASRGVAGLSNTSGRGSATGSAASGTGAQPASSTDSRGGSTARHHTASHTPGVDTVCGHSRCTIRPSASARAALDTLPSASSIHVCRGSALMARHPGRGRAAVPPVAAVPVRSTGGCRRKPALAMRRRVPARGGRNRRSMPPAWRPCRPGRGRH